ncbi:MAG: hypothetical protein KKB50_08715 [Planctomycetes bacterium]|nr:hypothetical protein [Planctomycetota bacterium]
MAAWLSLLVGALLVGAGPAAAQTSTPASRAAHAPNSAPAEQPRLAEFLRAKQKARDWIDRLEVDPIELNKHHVKGKKKLAEILDAYLRFYRHDDDPAGRARIMARVRQMYQHTKRPEYHNMADNSREEFLENSMSYCRVAWLLEQFGLPTRLYRSHLRHIQPRLDEHLRVRGAWQRAMFARYYDAFGLEKPPILCKKTKRTGVIERRLPLAEYQQRSDGYDLTHEIFVAYNYGYDRTQSTLTEGDLAYARKILPALARRYMQEDDSDLLAEVLSCLTYLGWRTLPEFAQARDYLLDHQNANGTWGDWEEYRVALGDYVEQYFYLHNTMVAIHALMAVYEGDWPAAPE